MKFFSVLIVAVLAVAVNGSILDDFIAGMMECLQEHSISLADAQAMAKATEVTEKMACATQCIFGKFGVLNGNSVDVEQVKAFDTEMKEACEVEPDHLICGDENAGDAWVECVQDLSPNVASECPVGWSVAECLLSKKK